MAIPRLKILVCPNICPKLEVENWWIHTCPKSISALWNANSLVQDLLAVSISLDSNHYTKNENNIVFKISEIDI